MCIFCLSLFLGEGEREGIRVDYVVLEKGSFYLPTSMAGEARGESSMEMLNMPSNCLSGYGTVTCAEARARTLSGVNVHLAKTLKGGKLGKIPSFS